MGHFGDISNKPQYFLTMHMLKEERDFIFDGGILNINPCLKGKYGPLCLPCPPETYKNSIGSFDCTKCPKNQFFDCSNPKNKNSKYCKTQGLTSISQCMHGNPPSEFKEFLDLIIIILIVALFMLFFYIVMRRKKKYDDKNFGSSNRFKVNDIPSTVGRIFVAGDNTPEMPWRIERLSGDITKYFDIGNLNKFREVKTPQKNFSLIFLLRNSRGRFSGQTLLHSCCQS